MESALVGLVDKVKISQKLVNLDCEIPFQHDSAYLNAYIPIKPKSFFLLFFSVPLQVSEWDFWHRKKKGGSAKGRNRKRE